ncbi:MAG TPA: STAS domain-containing protein [Bryobacteraceae bacterium]|nr:STAS domain-containing protein [Bryobacteraceae bacterium]
MLATGASGRICNETVTSALYTCEAGTTEDRIDPWEKRGCAHSPSLRSLTLKEVFDFQSVIRGLHDPVTIIDVAGVPYMDSASLGSVIGFHASCQRQGRRYALVGLSERIQTLFRVAGVARVLVTYPHSRKRRTC